MTLVSAGNTLRSGMPIYEYRCTQCDTRFTQAETIAEHGRRHPECPKCRSQDVEPLLSAFFAKTIRKS